eukprot:CAMPEP_0171988810 /NCGR_PEP_ID=MMETSP0993-20121228/276092_1 /TAXON_ID=483369 /ORGANISM="non described non described, Strain CCMP2098" /LENGTH=230 /DNA_ID=CAMNT_0012641787 /DNA_START=114 /DNA_END=806 /DNA_ORIENTATION=-
MTLFGTCLPPGVLGALSECCLNGQAVFLQVEFRVHARRVLHERKRAGGEAALVARASSHLRPHLNQVVLPSAPPEQDLEERVLDRSSPLPKKQRFSSSSSGSGTPFLYSSSSSSRGFFPLLTTAITAAAGAAAPSADPLTFLAQSPVGAQGVTPEVHMLAWVGQAVEQTHLPTPPSATTSTAATATADAATAVTTLTASATTAATATATTVTAATASATTAAAASAASAE